jgi:DNA-binding CsgD family transcriptional regulator
VLLDRSTERQALDRMLEDARRGHSRVLVLRGEPGVGKSALLEYVVEQASGCRIARAAGVQSEMELAYAGLQQLGAPMPDGLPSLPEPQRDALRTAFGLRGGPAPDRFLVGLAVLGLLAEVADTQPLVCLIDDAQWLDRASLQALEFAARRLFAESVALVFAARPSEAEQPLTGLPELVVEGLADSNARALLDSVIRWPLDERVRDRIVAETRGNPLALLELPRGLTPAELAGGFGLPAMQPLPARIEHSFQRRLAPLPADTRRLLLLAAAEPLGDSTPVWRAASRLGIGIQAADAAESEELVEFNARVRFRHPLVRSAIYRAASPQQRRDAHRALAEVTDPQIDPDRRAWHLAQATSAPDEAVAGELERSAGRAQARGGLAAAAAFLERATELTPDSTRKGERALGAARTNAQAGAFDIALRLLATADAGPLDELQRARADLLRGQIALSSNRGRDAPPLLLNAAKRLEPLDVGLARQTYLEALSSRIYAGRLATGPGLVEIADEARVAPPASQPPTAPDLLLDGLSLLVTEGHAVASSTLKAAIDAFSGEHTSTEDAVRWLWLVSPATLVMWDEVKWELLSARHIKLLRDIGAIGELPMALSHRAGLHLHEGDFAAASCLIEEGKAITDATRGDFPPYAPVALAAFRGREPEATEVIEINRGGAADRGEGIALSFIEWGTAVLHNGLARYRDALAAAQRSFKDRDEVLFSTWAAVELIEAATRSGTPEHATGALEQLTQSTRASGSEWALGIEARSRALLSDGPAAEALYREAIERLARTRIVIDLARAHLLYGEWLRREARRSDARDQLRTAHDTFVAMGADGFAERAARELTATGETARKRTADTSTRLTAQEAQVARLARDGLSNLEIGTRLYISHRTVQYHLSKVFTKLDITTRVQLARVLPGDPNLE